MQEDDDLDERQDRVVDAVVRLEALDDARGAYTQALQLEPEDETWKTALYRLLDKHAAHHSKRSMVLDEIRGSGYGAAVACEIGSIIGDLDL